MDSEGLRSRVVKPSDTSTNAAAIPQTKTTASQPAKPHVGLLKEAVRLILLISWWMCCTFTIHITQLLGTPLYLINRDYYYAYMALTKQQYGVFISTLTQWFAATPVVVSGDSSVRSQLKYTSNGRLETDFPERLVLIANHQLYTDWLYLWWIAYTSRMHGHIFIVLKETFKYVPIVGPAMSFWGFIFMSRKWANDQSRIAYRLRKLTASHSGPMSGSAGLDPMWLLIYPEGTNMSANTRKSSAKWAEKQGIPDMKHQVIPRSTGLQFVLSELKNTMDYVYDCTVAYGGIPPGSYGQDLFGLRTTYIQGNPPSSVNFYFRRFRLSDIPVDNPKAFEAWVMKVWREKDELLEHYAQNGRFPPNAEDNDNDSKTSIPNGSAKDGSGWIETEVRLASWVEVGQIFVVLATLALLASIGARMWNFVFYGKFCFSCV